MRESFIEVDLMGRSFVCQEKSLGHFHVLYLKILRE